MSSSYIDFQVTDITVRDRVDDVIDDMPQILKRCPWNNDDGEDDDDSSGLSFEFGMDCFSDLKSESMDPDKILRQMLQQQRKRKRTNPPNTCKVFITGVTMEGKKVLCMVHNFRPWMYASYMDQKRIEVLSTQSSQNQQNHEWFIQQGFEEFINDEIVKVPSFRAGQPLDPNWNPIIESVEQLPHFYGFRPDEQSDGFNNKEYLFWKISFPKSYQRRQVAKKMRDCVMRRSDDDSIAANAKPILTISTQNDQHQQHQQDTTVSLSESSENDSATTVSAPAVSAPAVSAAAAAATSDNHHQKAVRFVQYDASKSANAAAAAAAAEYANKSSSIYNGMSLYDGNSVIDISNYNEAKDRINNNQQQQHSQPPTELMDESIFRKKYQVWEDDQTPELQFMIKTNIKANGWVRLKNVDFDLMQPPRTTSFGCDYEYLFATVGDFEPLEELNKHIAPMKIGSFDIEVYSSRPGVFPSADVLGDCVTHIGLTVQRYDDAINCYNAKRFMLCLYDTETIRMTKDSLLLGVDKENAAAAADSQTVYADIETRCYNTEAELLLAFQHLAMEECALDMIFEYNGRKFDWQYLYKRACLLESRRQPNAYDLVNRFCRFSQLRGDVVVPKKDRKDDSGNVKKEGSKQQGFFDTWCWERTFGFLDIDVMLYLQKNVNHGSYKLNDMSAFYLKDKKIDLHANEMFELFKTGGPAGRRIIGEYCVKDCDLPMRLVYRLQIIVQQVEMSRLTYTFIEDLLSRGQTLKIRNVLSVMNHKERYLFSHCLTDFNRFTIKGATVLEPKKGFYIRPVTTFDFMSLYPSIIRAHNLCPTTYVGTRPKTMSFEEAFGRSRYAREEAVDHEITEKGIIHTFITHREGIVPKIERIFMESRSAVKKLIPTAENSMVAKVYDARQLILKLVCNSIYGFFTSGMMNKYACVAIGETVTANGRRMIEASKSYVEKNYQTEHIYNVLLGIPVPESMRDLRTEIIYGDTDSIMVHMPLEPTETGLRQMFQIGPRMSKEISAALFKAPIFLDFEKVYFPYYLLKKKRYVGRKYEDPNKKPSIDQKGLETKRRDTLPFTVRVLSRVQDILMNELNTRKASEYIEHEISHRFMEGDVNYEEFILSKKLNADYKNPNAVVHLHVVNQIKKRNPGSEPKIGDRVKYVILYTPNRKELLANKGEDPDYAKEHKLKLDYIHYIEHSIKKPVISFFKTFDPMIETKMDTWIAKLDAKLSGMQTITSCFKPISSICISSNKSNSLSHIKDITEIVRLQEAAKKKNSISTKSAVSITEQPNDQQHQQQKRHHQQSSLLSNYFGFSVISPTPPTPQQQNQQNGNNIANLNESTDKNDSSSSNNDINNLKEKLKQNALSKLQQQEPSLKRKREESLLLKDDSNDNNIIIRTTSRRNRLTNQSLNQSLDNVTSAVTQQHQQKQLEMLTMTDECFAESMKVAARMVRKKPSISAAALAESNAKQQQQNGGINNRLLSSFEKKH